MGWDKNTPSATSKVSAGFSATTTGEGWLTNWYYIQEWTNIEHLPVCASNPATLSAVSGEHYMGRVGFLGIGTSATYAQSAVATSANATCAASGAIWYDRATKGALQLVSNDAIDTAVGTTVSHYFSAGEVSPTAYRYSAGYACAETSGSMSQSTATQISIDSSLTTSGCFDILGEFTANTLTIRSSGYYLIIGAIQWRYLDEYYQKSTMLYVNDTLKSIFRTYDYDHLGNQVADVLYLTAGQTVKLYGQTGASTLAGRKYTHASLSWVRLS